MAAERGEVDDWDQGVPYPGEASLLLAEHQHRVANEVACAVAAMRLAKHAGLEGPRVELFDAAIARLEGFGSVVEVLAPRPSRTIDVGAALHRLCRGLVAGRDGLQNTRIGINVSTPPLPGGAAHRLLLIAAELIFNGIRHALVDRAGWLNIEVYKVDDSVRLAVSDDGPGIRPNAPTSGTGLGTGIIDELVRRGDGRMECDTDRFGSVFRVTLPLCGRSPIGWIVKETVA